MNLEKLCSFVLIAAMPLMGAGCATSTASEEGAASQDAIEQSNAITLANWQSHPKIAEVRAVQTGVDKATLIETKRDHSCPDGMQIERVKYADKSGKLHKVFITWTREDAITTQTAYYDAAGKMRFALTVVNGVKTEEHLRSYFDKDGERLWDVNKRAAQVEEGHDEEAPRPIDSAPFVHPIAPMIYPDASFNGTIFESPFVCT